MTSDFLHRDDAYRYAAAGYLGREPEYLVVNGYRGWLQYAVDQNEAHLSNVFEALRRSLGDRAGGSAMAGLNSLIRQLGKCATCPLRFRRPNTDHLCRDECLLLSMIAGLQHGDEEAALEGAAALTCRARAEQVLAGGSEFAMVLKFADQQLLPIPVETVRWVVNQSLGNPPHTLH